MRSMLRSTASRSTLAYGVSGPAGGSTSAVKQDHHVGLDVEADDVGLDRCARRTRLAEDLAIDAIHRLEVLEVAEVDANADRLRERRARGLGHRLQIREDLSHLSLDRAVDEPSG